MPPRILGDIGSQILSPSLIDFSCLFIYSSSYKWLRPRPREGENGEPPRTSLAAFLTTSKRSVRNTATLLMNLFVSTSRIWETMTNAFFPSTSPMEMWYGFFLRDVVSGTTRHTCLLKPRKTKTGRSYASPVPFCSKPMLRPNLHHQISRSPYSLFSSLSWIYLFSLFQLSKSFFITMRCLQYANAGLAKPIELGDFTCR